MSIMTYDLMGCHYETVYLDSWEIILPFIPIILDKTHVLALDEMLNNLLKRPIEDDLKK